MTDNKVNQEFQNLIQKRKNWITSSKDNNFDFDSILAGLYNDPSHFIFELLQNAEDEGATEVRFELFEGRLDFYHNGKDFDLEDIDGVTGIGISKKKEDLTSIGKFGVGFKSVFAITQSPLISSGQFQFKIEDFVIPTEVELKKVQGTLISLPFNHTTRSAKEVYALISDKLENINLKTMLFLNNIDEIRWQTLEKVGHYLRSKEGYPNFLNVKKVTVISVNTSEEFLVIEKNIAVDQKKLKVEVAYRLSKDENGKEIIIPEDDSKLVVYFPTERATHLHFIIQGPYKTTPNRENIPLSDPQNKIILEETANLVSESFLIIKDLGLLDVSFFNLLPLNLNLYDWDIIYKTMFNVIKKTIIDDELLPTADGRFCKPAQALLARGKELTEFLSDQDIEDLFSRKHWLDPSITYDRTRNLRDYLINELSVIEIDFENFARKITATFLEQQTDEWIIDFYSRLLDQSALWTDRFLNKGILRNKPIIRLENGNHIKPYDYSGTPLAYLPTETSSRYNTVKNIIVQNESARKFLVNLGLTEPDLLAEIREFILPKYTSENLKPDDSYFEDFNKLLKASQSISSNKENEFKKELKNASFIYCSRSKDIQKYLKSPEQVYIRSAQLVEYFENSPDIYFVSEDLYEKYGCEIVNIFLSDYGVENKPRIRRNEKVADLSYEERINYVGYTGRNVVVVDAELEGLDNLINGINLSKSLLLWQYLLQHLEEAGTWAAQNYFKAEFRWYYQTGHAKKTESSLLKILKNTAWLYDIYNIKKRPAEISISEMHKDYVKGSIFIDILKKELEFKPDIIEQLPDFDRKILEIARANDLTPEKFEQLIKEKKPESSNPTSIEESTDNDETTWIPEQNPEDVEPRITDIDPAGIIAPDFEGQMQNGESEVSEESQNGENTDGDKNKEKSLPDSKTIGEWGEKYVLKTLKDKFTKTGPVTDSEFGFTASRFPDDLFEVIWLNKNGNRGKGYDFVVKKNDAEIEYIEVKTKTKDGHELIKITGSQWEFARKLYNQNEGDKYSIYVVLNAGEATAEIRVLHNPIKLWKEGKLYAHPVNFKL